MSKFKTLFFAVMLVLLFVLTGCYVNGQVVHETHRQSYNTSEGMVTDVFYDNNTFCTDINSGKAWTRKCGRVGMGYEIEKDMLDPQAKFTVIQ